MNQPQSHCQSCGMPAEGQYCEYCTDESGALKPREEVREGLAAWLSSFAPEKSADFRARADHYMAAMPAWADA